MNVLLTTDFSPGAFRARELARSLRYPDGTLLEVLHVLDPDGVDLVAAFTGIPPEGAHKLEREIARFSDPLRSGRRSIRPRVRIGDPARQISRHAGESGADLVILGRRDRGPLTATLFGSVTAGVLDRAQVPVLVARTSAIDQIILADDGSPAAAGAADQLANSPLFADAVITVVSVVAAPSPNPGAFPHVDDYDAYLIGRKYARARADAAVAERVAMLGSAGRRATGEVRQGDVAAEILDSARAHRANLIVAGTRGVTGLRRLFLGSVTRQLLSSGHSSLLIARATGPSGQSTRIGEPRDEVSYEHRQPPASRAA